VHLLELLFHVFIEAYLFEKQIQNPAQKEPWFMLKNVRIEGLFLSTAHGRSWLPKNNKTIDNYFSQLNQVV
jgi:hypothetical protein